MDRPAHISAASPQCLAWRMEKIVLKVLHPRKGRALESEKTVQFDLSHRKGRTGNFAAHSPVRRPDAVRLRQHLNGKTKI